MPTYNPHFVGPCAYRMASGGRESPQRTEPISPYSCIRFDIAVRQQPPRYVPNFGNTSRALHPTTSTVLATTNWTLRSYAASRCTLPKPSRFNFRAEMYNVTNHTFFGVASTAVGNGSFGQVTTNASYNRRAVQLSGRIEF